jgi:putative endonuclease
LGKKGERLAAHFLKRLSYRIVATNFVSPIGYSRNGRQVTGEIDIIAYDESSIPYTLVFIEIKTRTSAEIAAPQAAVDLRKQRQIVRTSRVYRRLMSVENEPYRYDVISIVLAHNQDAEVTLLRGYFSELKFERSGWLAS